MLLKYMFMRCIENSLSSLLQVFDTKSKRYFKKMMDIDFDNIHNYKEWCEARRNIIIQNIKNNIAKCDNCSKFVRFYVQMAYRLHARVIFISYCLNCIQSQPLNVRTCYKSLCMFCIFFNLDPFYQFEYAKLINAGETCDSCHKKQKIFVVIDEVTYCKKRYSNSKYGFYCKSCEPKETWNSHGPTYDYSKVPFLNWLETCKLCHKIITKEATLQDLSRLAIIKHNLQTDELPKQIQQEILSYQMLFTQF